MHRGSPSTGGDTTSCLGLFHLSQWWILRRHWRDLSWQSTVVQLLCTCSVVFCTLFLKCVFSTPCHNSESTGKVFKRKNLTGTALSCNGAKVDFEDRTLKLFVLACVCARVLFNYSRSTFWEVVLLLLRWKQLQLKTIFCTFARSFIYLYFFGGANLPPT